MQPSGRYTPARMLEFPSMALSAAIQLLVYVCAHDRFIFNSLSTDDGGAGVSMCVCVCVCKFSGAQGRK